MVQGTGHLLKGARTTPRDGGRALKPCRRRFLGSALLLRSRPDAASGYFLP